ncbi:MAG: hypothetical protein Q8936_18060 [Bacillota bacterium]|nr:hypothetical protein [Bacillota bacterium]
MENTPCKYNIMELVEDMGVSITDISSLYSEYITEMRSNIQESKFLCSEKDWTRLERVIHNMKGISTSLNITDLYEVSAALDKQLKLGKYDDVQNDINHIEELFNIAEKDIKEFFKQHSITI